MNDYDNCKINFKNRRVEDVDQVWKEVVKTLILGGEILDFGCGAGRNIPFLSEFGRVTGVDTSEKLVSAAREKHSNVVLSDGILNFKANTFDFVFSRFVLVELSPSIILSVLKDIYKVLKVGGSYVFVTGNSDLYTKPISHLENDFPENKKLICGKQVKVIIKSIDLELKDYYYTKEKYIELLKKTGFKVEKIESPSHENQHPYLIFKATKSI